MKKIYRFVGDWTEEDVLFLSKFGIETSYGFKSINVEDGETYQHIHARFSKGKHCFECFGYDYDEVDIQESEYCILGGISGTGYPEPSDTFGYKDLVFDANCICPKCWVGKKQVGDYRIKKRTKRPLWGFMAWEFDVIFMTEDLYQSVFAPLGLGCRTVRKPSGAIFEGIVQLVIPIIEEDLDLSMHKFKVCPVCGKKKYTPEPLYPFFSLHEHPLPHIYLSKEFFGEGFGSNRRIFISTELAMKLVKYKLIKENGLTPCKRNLAEYLKTIKY